jgi:glucose-1-phosphate cytidylyltransferase
MELKMKVVILAGGRGTRVSEETQTIPKPMVEIGGKPILWHIMKIYSYYGFYDFIVCLGYRGYIIKEYFSHYFMHMSDVTIDLKKNRTIIHNTSSEPWRITLVDTGIDTMTGGRLKRIQPFIEEKSFMMTYGDGLADIDLRALLSAHRKHKRAVTLTAVQTSLRFGILDINANSKVNTFLEKPTGESSWINGGFFVLEPEVFSYLKDGDLTVWEREPLEQLAKLGQLAAYRHRSYWQCMDTLRDKNELEGLIRQRRAPWMMWEKR